MKRLNWCLTGCALVLHAASAYGQTPTAPMKACAVLTAKLSSGQAQSGALLDTARIQTALNFCSPGKAFVLKSSGTNTAFAAAPLMLPRGVTLVIDSGVTLFASRNPRDYDLAPQSCGAAPAGNAPNCKPFLFSYQAAYSGVTGGGAIDGQGSSWWGKTASVPDLVSSYESQGFQIAGIALRNAAGVHAAIFKTTGLSRTAATSSTNADLREMRAKVESFPSAGHGDLTLPWSF